MTDENNQEEALKADESQNEVESPATENEEGLDLIDGPIDESLRPEESEGEEVEADSTDDAEAEGTPDEESEAPREGRKTAQSRIRELVAEKKELEKRAEAEKVKAESLSDQIRKATSRRPDTPDFTPQSDESELTYEELMRRQDALVQIRLAQQENIHRVQSEAAEATKAHPELDPDSETFDPELSESISQAVLAKVQADPTADVKGFVSSLMKPYKRSLEKQEAGQKEAITKQVSQQATRPTQVQNQEKPFSELSIEEMEKKLGVVYR